MSLFPEYQLRIIESSEAALRLEAAHEWLLTHAGRGAVIVGASRGAADDLARSVAKMRGGALGLHRFSFTQLAAHLAAPVLASRGAVPVTRVGTEAVAARATFEAQHGHELTYFAPVASTPGFPRALARTLNELALARVGPDALRRLPLGGADLAVLFERFDAQFTAASATDRATLFEAATEAADTFSGRPLLMLDVALESSVEFALAQHLIAKAAPALVLVPFGDLATLEYLKALGVEPDVRAPVASSDLTALRRNLFAGRQPPEREPTGEVRVFSAPGESRECVEIARRILQEARDGHALRRDRGRAARAGPLCRPARGCVRSRWHSRLVRARRATSASRRPRLPRDPRLRGGTAVRAQVCGIPVARPGSRSRGSRPHARALCARRRQRDGVCASRAASPTSPKPTSEP